MLNAETVPTLMLRFQLLQTIRVNRHRYRPLAQHPASAPCGSAELFSTQGPRPTVLQRSGPRSRKDESLHGRTFTCSAAVRFVSISTALVDS